MTLIECSIQEDSSRGENLFSLLSAALGNSETYDKIVEREDTIPLTDMRQQSWSEEQVKQAFSEIRDKLAPPKGYKLTVLDTAVILEKRLSR